MARNFTQKTLRGVEASLIVLALVGITIYGAHSVPGPERFATAFFKGVSHLVRDFFSPFFAAFGVSPTPKTDLAGEVTAIALVVAFMIYLDTVSARRSSPTVDVQKIEVSGEGSKEVKDELKFMLAAVELKKPPLIPGSSTVENIASVAESFQSDRGRVFGAFMRLIKSIEPKPRSFGVRLRVENTGSGSGRLFTIDLCDKKTEQSVVVKTMAAEKPEDVARKAAAFIGRYVFLQDRAMPGWMSGSIDGEDLNAYLESKRVCSDKGGREEQIKQRERRKEILSTPVMSSPSAGLVRHELALLHDMDGEHLESIRLNLINRVFHPDFKRARFRLASSLSMLAAEDTFGRQWKDAEDEIFSPVGEPRKMKRSQLRKEITRLIERSEVSAPVRSLEVFKEMTREGGEGNPEKIRKALLDISVNEFKEFYGHLSLPALLSQSVFFRKRRMWNLSYLTDRRSRRDMRYMAKVGRYLAEMRRFQLSDDGEVLVREVRKRRRKAAKFVKKTGIVIPGDLLKRPGGPWLDGRFFQEFARLASRLPMIGRNHDFTESYPASGPKWQLVYNTACLFAIPEKGGIISEKQAETVIHLLEHAVYDPLCNLPYPSEWLEKDPDLIHLKRSGQCVKFQRFLDEVQARDFPPSPSKPQPTDLVWWSQWQLAVWPADRSSDGWL
ncbi:hypothetical protein ABGB12_00435 [Actinocorallia sp. B10E7]|uniref:hypothetical protein n=1 Tax=Actinocorallia sp. B10E7 TaxID=3153558 RepID=UPI00325EF420